MDLFTDNNIAFLLHIGYQPVMSSAQDTRSLPDHGYEQSAQNLLTVVHFIA